MGIDFVNERSVSRSQEAAKTYNLDAIVSRMIQLGKVMAVDEEKHAARVKFEATGIISGWLKVVDARPYFPDYDEELTEQFDREPECERVRWEENEDTGEKDILIVETEDMIYPFEGEDPQPTPEPEPDPEPEPEPDPEEDGEEDGAGEDGEGGEGGGGEGSGSEEPDTPEEPEEPLEEPEEPVDPEPVTPEDGDEYGGVRSHSNKVKTRMWLPHIDDMVLCLFLPVRNGAGFILGKIWQ